MESLAASSTFAPASPANKRLKLHSCTLCQQRKVKCDRQDPCSACSKAQVECCFRAPVPSRRLKRSAPEQSLVARLKRYEELLKSSGISIPELDRDDSEIIPGRNNADTLNTEGTAIGLRRGLSQSSTRPEMTGPTSAKTGRLIVERGMSRYVEKYGS